MCSHGFAIYESALHGPKINKGIMIDLYDNGCIEMIGSGSSLWWLL
jgi:hypothetical protein